MDPFRNRKWGNESRVFQIYVCPPFFHSLAFFKSLSSGQLAPLHQFQGKQVMMESELEDPISVSG